MSEIIERAEGIGRQAALKCADCRHSSAHHSDIGTCEVAACPCLCFEEE